MNPIPSKKDNFSEREIEGEIIIIPIVNNIADMNKVYTLNKTGAIIWNNVNGKNSIDDLAKIIYEKYDITFEEAKNDVYLTLEKLAAFLS